MNLESLTKDELILAMRRYFPGLTKTAIAGIRLQYLETKAVALTERVRLGELALASVGLTDKQRYYERLAVDVNTDELADVKADIQRLTETYFGDVR